jgi:Spy/CpxP family protein refolding chaperone
MNKTMFRRIAMRAGAVALCSAALCTVPMLAQGGGAGGPGGGGGGGGRGMRMTPDQQVANLDKAVTLTADQKTKVLAIYTDEQTKMQALMQAQDPDARTKITQMRNDDRAKIRALLTPDQQTKFDAMPAPGRGGGGPGGGGGAPPTPPPGQ